MWYRIDLSSGLPVYRQIIEQVRRAVASGLLKPGDQLPTVRDLAVELTVNFNTVSRAYMELQRDGIIVSGAGRGSFVAPQQAPPPADAGRLRAQLLPEVDRMLVAAYHLGLTADDVYSLVNERLPLILKPADEGDDDHDKR